MERITFVGHATVLLELGGVRLLTDPLLRDRFLVVRRHSQPPDPETGERIDAALISHMHADHLDFPSLKSVDTAQLIVPAGTGRAFERRGFAAPTELAPGERASVGAVEVEATQAIHDGRRYKAGRRVEAVGYLVRSPRTTVYFAGDTDLYDAMEEFPDRVDVALLPIGGWGPRVGKGHLNPKRAAQAAAMIAPRIVVPIHWGTFLRADLGHRADELLRAYPRELAAEIARRAPGVELQVLEPGESLEVPAAA